MSPTSTTISAHIDLGVPDVVLHTPRPGLHIGDVTLRSAAPVSPSMGVNLGASDSDEEQKVSSRVRSRMDLHEMHKGDLEPDMMRHDSRSLLAPFAGISALIAKLPAFIED